MCVLRTLSYIHALSDFQCFFLFYTQPETHALRWAPCFLVCLFILRVKLYDKSSLNHEVLKVKIFRNDSEDFLFMAWFVVSLSYCV